MQTIDIPNEQIPATAFCHCPAKRFALVRIREACVQCPHFAGLVEFYPRGGSFDERVRPLCAHPIARAVVNVEA